MTDKECLFIGTLVKQSAARFIRWIALNEIVYSRFADEWTYKGVQYTSEELVGVFIKEDNDKTNKTRCN